MPSRAGPLRPGRRFVWSQPKQDAVGQITSRNHPRSEGVAPSLVIHLSEHKSSYEPVLPADVAACLAAGLYLHRRDTDGL